MSLLLEVDEKPSLGNLFVYNSKFPPTCSEIWWPGTVQLSYGISVYDELWNSSLIQ